MARVVRFLTPAGLMLLALTALPMSAGPANAVVCKTVGVPKGCVAARPRGAVVVRRDLGFRGTPMNRGGPVNRIGRR